MTSFLKSCAKADETKSATRNGATRRNDMEDLQNNKGAVRRRPCCNSILTSVHRCVPASSSVTSASSASSAANAVDAIGGEDPAANPASGQLDEVAAAQIVDVEAAVAIASQIDFDQTAAAIVAQPDRAATEVHAIDHAEQVAAVAAIVSVVSVTVVGPA